MPAESPLQEELAELAYEPDRYWAVWQLPEARYAYSIDSPEASWMILLAAKETGEAYLASDARQNGRPLAAYRLDELTLPEAFDAARAQSTPFRSSYGDLVHRVLGIVLISHGPDGMASIQHIPL